jgi:hypothetical protein
VVLDYKGNEISDKILSAESVPRTSVGKHHCQHVASVPSRTQSIAKGLQAWPYYPVALLVTINSAGGSVAQARAIADLLHLHSNRHKLFFLLFSIPVITFAEDACLGSANIVLTAGVKAYASMEILIKVNFR